MAENEKLNNVAVDNDVGTMEDVDAIMKKYDRESNTRVWEGTPRKILRVLTALFGIFLIVMNMWIKMDERARRPLFLGLVIILVFIYYPIKKGSQKVNYMPWYDIVMAAVGAFCFFFYPLNLEKIVTAGTRIQKVFVVQIGSVSIPLLIVFAIVGTLILVECCRRVVGMPIICVATVFVLYAFLGAGKDLKTVMYNLFYTTTGILGTPIGVCSTYIALFVIFGAFLEATGVANFFIDCANALVGWASGGPAKVAVVSSALCGMVSGSSVGNTVTTGSVTIPMMKKTGYTAEEAGAIETCASTGGQIMPPIMGTGAFILAETVGVPYSDVCFVSIIPAILFYIAIYFLVDLIARKRNLHGLPASDIRPLKQTMHAGGVFFIPILILVVLLVLGYTPFLSGVGCALLILLIGQIRKDTRVSAKKIVFALEDCAKSLMSIGGVIFCASLIVSMINITGLMMKTSALILSFSQGKLWLTLLLVALIAYILGMGLPISTSYIILATLSAPAIVSLGVDMLVVHLTIFWFTQLATITPPVCMTAFAAAGIAQGQPMKTGFTALKMGFTFYYVPVLFVYSQLINGAWWVQCIIAVFAIIAIYFLGTFTEKYFMGDLGNIQRFTGLAVFAAIYFMMFDGLTMPMRGALLALAVALIASLYIVQKKKHQAAA